MTVLILLPCAKGGPLPQHKRLGGKHRSVRTQRGSSHNIGAIKDLEIGDTIRYQTSLGTRTYAVSSVKIIDWTDWSYLNSTSDNRITIITCLANQPTKRVCVQGIEISS